MVNRPQEMSETELEPFRRLILKEFGFSLGAGREESLPVGLRNRMHALKTDSVLGYLQLLERDAEERSRLVEHLTINETYFFRESSYLSLMLNRLIPDLMTGRRGGRIRILSAGCSTGEEPYSIAILLHEHYGPESLKYFEVAGIDIDDSAIRRALRGVYGKHSFRGMDKERLHRYFESVDPGQYRLRDEIRSMVSFQTVNLRTSLYPDFMRDTDILFYRNVSIYFAASVQKEVFMRLAGCLRAGGYLVVSATETLHHNLGVLSLMEMEGLFVYRKLPDITPVDRRVKRRELDISPRPLLKRSPPEKTARKTFAPSFALRREEDVRILFDEALEKVRDHCPDQALFILKGLLEKDPAFIHAHTLVASIRLNMGCLQEARMACDVALSQDAGCLTARLMRGLIAYQAGEQVEALGYFREVLYHDARCWPAHFYLAELMNRMGEKKRALAAYGTALQLIAKGNPGEVGELYFPLRFHAEQFQAVCRHKLDLLKESER